MNKFLASLALALACAFTAAAQPPGQDATRITVVIDADTANEIDDLYAIVRALSRRDSASSGSRRRSGTTGSRRPTQYSAARLSTRTC